jgi:hypothetical protein
MFGKTTIVVLGLAAAFGSDPLQAQVVIDVAKITCGQYVRAKIATPDNIAIWLSGYYHGQRGSQTLDLQTLQDNINKIRDYCIIQDNANVPVVKAVEKLVGVGK